MKKRPQRRSGASELRLLDVFWREPVARTVLPNGLVLIVKPDGAARLASVQVWVKTGSIHEGVHCGSGLSHYLEHMVFKGTSRRTAREISATAQAHGGYINAYTTYDRTVYHVDLPSEHTEVAVDLLADFVSNPTLRPEDAEREREVILREISMTLDDPDHRLWEGLFATAFREHPYRYPIIGHRDIFAALTPEHIVRYHRARYAPENLTVVIVGDVEPAAAERIVRKAFGERARTGLAPVFVPPEPAQLAPREWHRNEDVELTRAVLSWPIPGLTHPDSPILDLLAMALGHGDSSVLWEEVREKAGLVHTIEASSWNPGSCGLFCISFTCEPAKRTAATAAIEKILARTAVRGVSAEALAKALRQTIVAEINSRKTMSGQAARLGAAEVVVGDLDYSRTYFERLAAAKPSDLRRVAQACLVPSRRTAVSLNPKEAAPHAPKPAGKGGPGAIPDFSDTRLPNGARLLLQRDRRLPNLHLRLILRGGPLWEAADRRGASALLATLLAKDTRRRSATEVARYLEEVGGSFYPFYGNNSLGLAAEVLPPDAGRALEAIADGATSPVFLASTFGIERDAQLASLRQDSDDVVVFARKLVRRMFFGAHPLALDAQGDEAGVRALAPGDLAALHRRILVGGNAVLSVAGDFDSAQLAPELKAFLSRLPSGAALAPPSRRETLPAAPGDFVENRPREQAVVLQAFPAPPLSAEDYHVGEVADELFSGMASRLFEKVREEKGLAYFVRAARVVGIDASTFVFFAGTQPGREKDVLAEIDAEIARVQGGGVEETELRRCQVRLQTARREGLQTNGSRAAQAGLDVLLGRPANDWKNYDARISAVTRESLAEFARKYFLPSRRVQLVVRP